jgi:16S rRNA (guanine1207-N2)-methyltransferase
MSPSTIEDHAQFKKYVSLSQSGIGLKLAVAQDLFGSHAVDAGTKLLLRTVAGRPFRKALDLGCGYGPIGLYLSLEGAGRREVHLVDRDALALEFAGANAEDNGAANVRVYGSLGYTDVEDHDFDLIASNIPAKAGDEAIAHLLTAAAGHLRPGGLAAVVVIASRSDYVSEVLEAEDIEVVERRGTHGYTVFHFRFLEERGSPEEPDLQERAYERGSAVFEAAGVRYEMQCAYDVEEFDTLAFHTSLASDLLLELDRARIDGVAVIDPGQGHLPVLSAAKLDPKEIGLIDRDLLALKYSGKNLVAQGFPEAGIRTAHTAAPLTEDLREADLVIDVLRSGEPPEAVDERIRRFPPGATAIVAGRSTPVTRALNTASALGLTVRARRRHRGSSAVLLVG